MYVQQLQPVMQQSELVIYQQDVANRPDRDFEVLTPKVVKESEVDHPKDMEYDREEDQRSL